MRRSTTTLTRTVGVLAASLLIAAGCTRSDGDTAKDDDAPVTTAATAGGGGGSRLDKGDFGDLTGVCSEGDGKASGTGVADNTMTIGVVTDKGAELRPGLNQEMYDAGTAFANWCNEHGGINGIKV